MRTDQSLSASLRASSSSRVRVRKMPLSAGIVWPDGMVVVARAQASSLFEPEVRYRFVVHTSKGVEGR